MSWYVAEAEFKTAIPGAVDYAPLRERAWLLISADSEESAHEKAVSIARLKEHTYENADRETVQWLFVGIERVREVMDEALTDGTELWSVITRVGDEDSEANEESIEARRNSNSP